MPLLSAKLTTATLCWCFSPAARPAAVCFECRRPFGFSMRGGPNSEHITPLLRELHRLKVLERIRFRLCVLAYRCLHGMAPSYLAGSRHLTSEIDTHRRLRSADTATLVVLSTNHCTLGDRGFPVASARAWNSLPQPENCTVPVVL